MPIIALSIVDRCMHFRLLVIWRLENTTKDLLGVQRAEPHGHVR